MFNQNPQSTKTEDKLPTWNQFLKASGKKTLPKKFLVNLIWTPGQWNNYTLQTERFRLRIPESSVYYQELKAAWETILDKDVAIFVCVADRDKGTFTLDSSENEPGTWDSLGENGVKWRVP